MRVLFTTFAARSHLYAQVPLAWALRSAGHDVRIAAQPDLADDITRTGLTAVPLGEPLNMPAEAATIDDRALEPEAADDPPRRRWSTPMPAWSAGCSRRRL